jgi:predicted  nucleic acid-binding Zn-ribbon protein
MAQNYYCKWCGVKHPSVSSLTANGCLKSPSKRHELYEGSEKKQYTCKHCGAKHPSISSLVTNGCLKSPSKWHEPAL